MYAYVIDSNPKSRMRLQIDENLKRIYGDIKDEPVPDRLTLLLEQLRVKALGEAEEGQDAP
jgi:hypothetical protein